MLGRMVRGWLNAYTEGGWLPKWASPGYRGSMVGTMGDVVLADAIVKELQGFDPHFDPHLAYEAIRKDAFEEPPEDAEGDSGVGRECLSAYLEKGYVPRDSAKSHGGVGGVCDQVVSRTLNYLQSDFAIAQAARKLGHEQDYLTLMARAANYSLLFDTQSGFFRSRDNISGKFTEPFDQFAWGGDYTEGGPWQYRFYLPPDPSGLSLLYAEGGLDMCVELERVHTSRCVFHIGGYSGEIHEMTEMCTNTHNKAPSQYAHNNQPDHHQLYMGIALSGWGSACAANSHYRIREVLRELYTAETDMFPGDEDNGEMAAWYVLSALGLYNLSPGGTEYTLGSPLFGSVEVLLSAEKILRITSVDNSQQNVYVQAVTWNDEQVAPTASGIAFSQLREGGTLTFYMGNTPRVQMP
jgi:predicted alpha-1,2-mannosidase